MTEQRTIDIVSIDTGDTVFHASSGETWTVAYVQDGRLAWCGWPEGEARLSDCALVSKATPEERLNLLRQWAEPVSYERRNDRRHRYAVYRLEQEKAA